MHSIWKFIEALPVWAQLAVLGSFLAGLGFSVKELMVMGVHVVRRWIEHRRTTKIMNFLSLQVNPEPLVADGYGLVPPSHIFCTSFKIAEAAGMSPLMVLSLLGKLKTEQRVEQQGTLDSWKISRYETEHQKFRKRKSRPVTASST